ncbi:MAG TPA: sulfate ABC transporter substrate-binding protein [Gemmataceae bacterium]|nr:sulfate ABC transporter substrate-binding protein [Gemmataceae bacterium]
MRWNKVLTCGGFFLTGIFAVLLSGCGQGTADGIELLNVSYDPTRELWQELNAQFIPAHERKTGQHVTIKQSHASSGGQARSVIDGLEADVVTLALWSDTDALRKKGLIADGWEERLPHHSLAYFSTIVFVVRKDNPKGIKTWSDLVKPGVEVITPNPKTSGNGRLSFLAAWGAVQQCGGSEEDACDFVTKLYQHTPVLDNGARGSTTTFAQKKIGDVHLTWENEAYLEVAETPGELEIVYPPVSIRAEPFVAVVDGNVDRKGTRAVAEAYLQFLYSDEAQHTLAKHHYRPINETIRKQYTAQLPELKLFPITAVAADWEDAQQKFFANGAIFDTIYQPSR